MTTNAFQQSILASFPPIPGAVGKTTYEPIPAAPPLPSSAPPAADKLSQSLTKLYAAPPAPPVPEAGFVNPPEAPKTAAVSPEHAAALQGIVPPAPPAPDDLDGLSRDQLKALAVLAGCEPENTRKRDAALRDSIRLHRAANRNAHQGFPSLPAAESVPAIVDVGAIDTHTPKQTEIDFDAPPHIEVEAPVVDVPSVDPIIGSVGGGQRALFTPHEEARKIILGYTLFVDCAPLDGDSVPFAALVARAGEMIVAAGGPNDYRLFDYGAGPGHLACAVSDLLDQHDGRDIVVESTTHEGMACLQTLISKAARVVRSFR